ncbi:extracellular solute-binding protein [Niallia sp. BSM11]|uniref:extracellular solute-binding protein n=1 Tax=Niallia sp. BSM11 TaxID=3391576 RepID=UPI0039855809
MKKLKKLCFFTFLIVSVVLAGCQNNKSNAVEDGTLTIWSTWMTPSPTVKSYEESPFHQNLEKESGVKLKWQFPTEGSDWSQAFNLMLSEKQLPDLIYYGWMGVADKYINEGAIRDLTKDIEEKAPNYWKFLKEHPEFDRAMKTDDGKYYMFGFFREQPYQASYMGPMIRQDWLEEQNLSLPENIADWTKTIEIFHEKYGAQLTFQTGWRMSPGFAGAFDAHGSFDTRYFIDKNGQVQLAQAQPEWRNYMAWFNDLYKKNLIDPDFATIDDQGVKTKASQDKTGATIMNAGTLLAMNTDATTNETGAEWVGAPYPNQADGTKSASIFTEDLYNAQGIAISTSLPEEELDAAFKFLDWAYTEEGMQYWNFGKEGESWEMVDGQPTFTDLITENKLGKDEAIALYTGNWLSGQGVQLSRFIEQRLDEPSFNASNSWSDGQEEAIDSIFPAAVSMTSEERKEASNLENTINTYVKEHALKFVTGEESLDKFDDFVKELNNQGLERLLEIRQAAYERYLKR